ncbi:MAG: hypothetical protein WA231_19870 [Methylocella sp.]
MLTFHFLGGEGVADLFRESAAQRSGLGAFFELPDRTVRPHFVRLIGVGPFGIGFEPIDLGADETALLASEPRVIVTRHHSGNFSVRLRSWPLALPRPAWPLNVRSIVGPKSGAGMPAYWPVRNAVVRSSEMPGHTVSIVLPATLDHIGTI